MYVNFEDEKNVLSALVFVYLCHMHERIRAYFIETRVDKIISRHNQVLK